MKEKYMMLQTKVSADTYRCIKRIEKKKGLTSYGIIQMMVDCIVRYMDDSHNLSEDMERAMSIFEHMAGWENALNLADPTVHKEICQAVYIFQDADGKKQGFRTTMVRKPVLGDWAETSNVMDIFERIFNVCLPELYKKLFRVRIMLGCERISEVILKLTDQALIEQINDEFRREFEDANRADNGMPYEYGRKMVQKKHRTIDSVHQDKRMKGLFDYEQEQDIPETSELQKMDSYETDSMEEC